MSRTVLLVEDTVVAREMVGGILQGLDCMVVSAEDGLDGLKKYRDFSGEIDLIVLDVQMPKMDGVTMLRYLRRLPGGDTQRVVMLTTQTDQDTVRSALKYKVLDFIRKDAPLPQITERLAKFLS
jgi:CheY-like chemotaxis protein